jgi:rhamnose transport system permease protein
LATENNVPDPVSDDRPSRRNTLKERLSSSPFGSVVRWESALVIALVLVFILGTSISPEFTSSYNIFHLCTNIGDLAIMAIPMTLIILTGEIDLSVASIVAMSSELLGTLWIHHWSMPLIFVVCLTMGVFAGLLNGYLIAYVGLPSLAVTIGTLTLYRGIASLLLGATSVSSFPTSLTNVGINGFFGIPWLSWSVAIFIVLAIGTGIMLRFTSFGRSLYTIGLNKDAAFYAGIRVKRIKLGLYVLSGFVCAAVGLLYTFELSSAAENIAIGFELQVVTIVLLGGVSIFGGRGTILGVALAAFVYAGLQSALLLTSNFNENDFEIVSGGLLILSVLIPNLALFMRRGREMLARRRGKGSARAAARSAPSGAGGNG